MYFITDRDPENDKPLSVSKLTKEGEQLALAFQSVIKDTEYYKHYRKRNVPVPRHVLEEYGRVIRFDFRGFTECKEIMKKYFFEDSRAVQLKSRSELLTESRDYVELLVHQYNISQMRGLELRRALYDYRLHNGSKIIIPDTLRTVAHKWEITTGRQYFTEAGKTFLERGSRKAVSYDKSGVDPLCFQQFQILTCTTKAIDKCHLRKPYVF